MWVARVFRMEFRHNVSFIREWRTSRIHFEVKEIIFCWTIIYWSSFHFTEHKALSRCYQNVSFLYNFNRDLGRFFYSCFLFLLSSQIFFVILWRVFPQFFRMKFRQNVSVLPHRRYFFSIFFSIELYFFLLKKNLWYFS